jgi:hypothetical protein
MATNLPARQDETPLAVTADPPGAAASDAGTPPVQQQNLAVALVPLALITLLVLAFIAAAWTFLAALPAA